MAHAKCFLNSTDAEKELVESRKRVRQALKANATITMGLKVKRRKLEKEESSITARLDEMMQERISSTMNIRSITPEIKHLTFLCIKDQLSQNCLCLNLGLNLFHSYF